SGSRWRGRVASRCWRSMPRRRPSACASRMRPNARASTSAAMANPPTTPEGERPSMDLDIHPADACDAGDIAALYNRYVADSIATFELDPVPEQEMRDRIADVQARGLPWLL